MKHQSTTFLREGREGGERGRGEREGREGGKEGEGGVREGGRREGGREGVYSVVETLTIVVILSTEKYFRQLIHIFSFTSSLT